MQPELDRDGRSVLGERDGYPYAPTDAETSWVDPPDPDVDYTARFVYDYRYQGAGNWPFNTAYAAERGLVGGRDDAPRPQRGGAVHRGRYPARRVGRLVVE